MIIPSASKVHVYPSPAEVGEKAGREVEEKIVELMENQETVRMVFAAAPSQDYLLKYLAGSSRIDWSRITAFHMDEYLGLEEGHPQLFSAYLDRHLFSKVKQSTFYRIQPRNESHVEAKRYATLLTQAPVDIICLGIGENGHIAFNEPLLSDFNDPEVMRVVKLDEKSRMQQVHDRCFLSLNEVPEYALSLTIPALMKGGICFAWLQVKIKGKQCIVHFQAGFQMNVRRLY